MSAKKVVTILLGGAALAAGGAAYQRHHQSAGTPASTAAVATAAPEASLPPVERSGRDSLTVPPQIAEKMKLGTAIAQSPCQPVALPPFQGVLALDNDHLSRVHARFAGEVVEIGHSTDGSDPTLRVGDQVKQGDLLAVVWSTDLGQKKSELVDAVGKLHAEEALRDRLKTLFEGGAGSGRSYRDADKEVQARLVEIASVERTLRTWRLTDEDIAAIRAEVEHVADPKYQSDDRNGWARVEIRAPMSGVILEKNIVVGDIVDTSTDLFKIGQLSQLAVWAHIYEEDLPLLKSCPRPTEWTISPPSNPGATFTGTLDKVSAVIDPVQHTALVTGRVDNSAGDLKIGQFVTVTIKVPPSEQELQLPATAVVENGWQSVVFVQPKASEGTYIRRPVQVVRRFRDEVFVHTGQNGLLPGDVIVTSGALMLQNAMDQLAPPAATASSEEETDGDLSARTPAATSNPDSTSVVHSRHQG